MADNNGIIEHYKKYAHASHRKYYMNMRNSGLTRRVFFSKASSCSNASDTCPLCNTGKKSNRRTCGSIMETELNGSQSERN